MMNDEFWITKLVIVAGINFLSHTRTYSDVHQLLWRDNMSGQSREGKPGGAVLLDVYILQLHLFWRDSEESRITVIFRQPNSTVRFSLSDLLPVDIHADLTRINDGGVSVQLFIGQQGTLNVVYPSEKKIWDSFLRKTYILLDHRWLRKNSLIAVITCPYI